MYGLIIIWIIECLDFGMLGFQRQSLPNLDAVINWRRYVPVQLRMIIKHQRRMNKEMNFQ